MDLPKIHPKAEEAELTANTMVQKKLLYIIGQLYSTGDFALISPKTTDDIAHAQTTDMDEPVKSGNITIVY